MAKLESLFSESTVVFGMRYQGLTVKQMQELRRVLPKESTLLVCKNTLVKRAADAVEGWGELKPAAKGDNAWLFVPVRARRSSVASRVAEPPAPTEPLLARPAPAWPPGIMSSNLCLRASL